MTQSNETKNRNLTWQDHTVDRHEREALLGQKGCVLWFTGLSGSGKSTVAGALEKALMQKGHLAYRLDGDNIRHGLNADLGFSPAERTENIRRIGEVAALFVDAGVIVLTAFISPYRADRARVKQTAAQDRFLEIYVRAPLAVCEQRDPKGLYRRARAGQIAQFTGIDAPYEEPVAADVILDTDRLSVNRCVALLLETLKAKGLLGCTTEIR
jgi:adenylyl-sulfate kinase